MNYLIVDTETKGLLKERYSSFTDTDNWPMIKQIAWLILDEELTEKKVTNYFTKEIEINKILEEFRNDIKLFNPIIIAHKMEFDKNVIGAELYRNDQYNFLINCNKICTMTNTIAFCNFPNYKYPSLQELHHKLFGKNFVGHHDALNDIKATRDCFIELKKRNFEFIVEEETIKDYPKYENHIVQLREDKKNAKMQSFALTEILKLFRTMPDVSSIDQEIKYLQDNFLGNLLSDQMNIGKDDNELPQHQVDFFKLEEKILIERLNLESYKNESQQSIDKTGTSYKLGIALGLSLIFFKYEPEILKKIASECQFYLIKYELFLREKKTSSLTSTDVLTMSRKRIEKGEVDLFKFAQFLYGLYPTEIYAEKLNRPDASIYEELNELDKTIKVIKPKLTEEVLLICYTKLLIDVKERVPNKFKGQVQDTIDFLHKKEGCFIATMCYGSYNSKEVVAFRQFRDLYLSKTQPGRLFINCYYIYSPKIVSILSSKKHTHSMIKFLLLNPIYRIIKMINK